MSTYKAPGIPLEQFRLEVDPQNGTSTLFSSAQLQLVHPVATGGIVEDVEINGIIYRVHSFLDVGAHTFNVEVSGNFEYLAVAGGGYGGGGGGGGGEVLENILGSPLSMPPLILTPGAYELVVGDGGVINPAGTSAAVGVGQNSTGFGLTALGGGRGNRLFARLNVFEFANGGNGGGAGSNDSAAQPLGGNPLTERGTRGGHGGVDKPNNVSTEWGAVGGGGGAGGRGRDGSLVDNRPLSGNGGPGLVVPIDGLNTAYGPGGGGGTVFDTFYPGFGGLGGGGNGATPTTPGTAGEPNTGGGGGGASYSVDNPTVPGGNGGSGLWKIRYRIG